MAVFASAHTVAEQLRPSHCAASCDDRAEASESAGISLRLGAWMSFIGLRLLLCMLSESFSQTYNIRSSDFPHRDVTFVIVVAGFGGWRGVGGARLSQWVRVVKVGKRAVKVGEGLLARAARTFSSTVSAAPSSPPLPSVAAACRCNSFVSERQEGRAVALWKRSERQRTDTLLRTHEQTD